MKTMEKLVQQNSRLGSGLVLISALMFGSYGVWSRLIGGDMGNFFQGWTRALIILLLLFPVLFLRGLFLKIQKHDRTWLVVFLIFTIFTQAPIFYAFNHMDIGSASLLFFVSMFLTMSVIGVFLYKEKWKWANWISMAMALVGMYLVFAFSLEKYSLFAAMMAVVNGIASGGEVAFSKKLTGKYSPLYITFLSWLAILPTNLFFAWLLSEKTNGLALNTTWLWQICYALASLFAFWLVIAGFKYISASLGALLGLMEIVFSVLFGVLIFGESLSLSIVVGAVLILLASGLPSMLELSNQSS